MTSNDFSRLLYLVKHIPGGRRLFLMASIKANSMRCGSHVIEDADLHKMHTIDEVLKKCGKPSSREGNKLYYKKKGKRLDFDTEGRLMSVNKIRYY